MSKKTEKEVSKEGSQKKAQAANKVSKGSSINAVARKAQSINLSKGKEQETRKMFNDNKNPLAIQKAKEENEARKPGRKKGDKNMYKIRNSKGQVVEMVNQHGVFLTVNDQKELKSLVDNFYKKRAKLRTSEVGLLMGYDENLELTQKKDRIMTVEFSKGMNQFKSYEEFEAYKAEIKRFNSQSYQKDVVNRYKDSFLKMLWKTTDIDTAQYEKIKKQINKMSQKEFAVRFGLGICGTIAQYYDTYAVSNSLPTKDLSQMTEQQLKWHEENQSRAEALGGGSVANLEDLYWRLGWDKNGNPIDPKKLAAEEVEDGERKSALDVSEKYQKYEQARQNEKAAKVASKKQQTQKKREAEEKYQSFLKFTNRPDNAESRKAFKEFQIN